MSSHNMDLLLLRVALTGSLIVGLMLILPSMIMVKHQAPHVPPAPHIAVNCWPPSHFTDHQVGFTEWNCLDNFRRFVQNESNAGVYPAFPSVIPDENETSIMDPELENVKKILNDRSSISMGSDTEQPALGLNTYSSVLIQLGLSIIIYAIASWTRSAALATGIKSSIEALQTRSLKRGPSEGHAGADREDLLDPAEGMASARVLSLYTSRTLVIIYLLLHLAAVISWFTLSAVNHHRAFDLITPGASVDKYQAKTNMTSDTIGGHFMCQFEIRRLGQIQSYGVQCMYDVQLPLNEVLFVASQERVLQDMAVDIVRSNAALCFILGALDLLYVFNIFLFAVKSRWHNLNPILQRAGIKITGVMSFGSSDLYLASALSE